MNDTIPDGEVQAASYPRRLLYRWFVEYNPLYLVSALLVLGGVTLLSRGYAEQSTMSPEVGPVAVIAEVYAAALIAGSALLTRIGLRRPAAMLALLTVLYQCDLTLFTERSVYLGLTGDLAVGGWLLSFVAKLYALAWAMRLRLSWSAVGVAAFGALGLAVLPRLLCDASAARVDSLAALWVFALFAAGLFTSREVTSKVTLDAWGHTVLARAQKATWLLWAGLVSFHVGFWYFEHHASPLALVPAALLLATRWMRREASVGCSVTGTLLLVGWVMPDRMSTAAVMAAVVLCLRALRRPTKLVDRVDEPRSTAPYRVPGGEESPRPVAARLSFARAPRDSMLRLLGGSVSCLYLAAWTADWSGGPLPEHVLALDVLFTVFAALLLMRARVWSALAPVAATYLHLAVQTHLIAAPSSTRQWGVTAVSLGFGLLLASLAVAWLHRKALRS